jgi:hypothetical protein
MGDEEELDVLLAWADVQLPGVQYLVRYRTHHGLPAHSVQFLLGSAANALPRSCFGQASTP